MQKGRLWRPFCSVSPAAVSVAEESRSVQKVHEGVENKENLVYLRANQKKRVPAANYGKSPVYAYFFDKFTFT